MATFGTFDDLLELAPIDRRPILTALRDLVVAIHPEAVEVVRLGDRAATYGWGPKKMSEGYVYLLPHAGWVNLGFYAGAELPDPDGLLDGTGARMRHVKVRSLEGVERPAVRALIEAAREERRRALGR